MTDTSIYVPFTGKADDAQRIVEGYVSSPMVDCDQQIVDQTWLKGELPPWLASYGNIREQHNPARAVGKAQAVDLDAEPGPYLRAKIVDDDAWRKVKEGVYNGFSIGVKSPRILRDGTAPNGRIVGGKLIEVSVVDRPANDAAKFVLVKAAGHGAWKDAQTGAVLEAVTQPATPDAIKCDLAGCDCDCHMGAPDSECDCQCTACKAARASVGMDADGDFDGDKAVTADAGKRDFNQAQRDAAADSGAALPDGSFPIQNVGDLKNAIQAIGRAKDRGKAMAHIKRRARALGASDQLPDEWKEADVDTTKQAETEPVAADAEKARQPRSEPSHAHPFKGAHNHAHDDQRGGLHTHAHLHDDDDVHDHPHLMGKDARMLSPEEREQATAMYRAADAELTKAAGEALPSTEPPAPSGKAAADFPATDGARALGRPATIGDVTGILKDALQRITALEGQTDHDKDGDIDTPANMAGGAMDKRPDGEFQGAQRADGINPGTLELTFGTEADLKKYISDTVAGLTKAAAADTTAANAEVVKLAGGLAKGLEAVVSRLEASTQETTATKAALAEVQADLAKVKEMAAPAKGAVFAIDKGIGMEPDRIYVGGAPDGVARKQAAVQTLAGLSEQDRLDVHRALLEEMYGRR